MGTGRYMPESKASEENRWGNFWGGGGVQLSATFVLTDRHILRILVGETPGRDGCGGGGTFVTFREAQGFGWDAKARRPRWLRLQAPGEDVRAVGSKFTMVASADWGSRRAQLRVVVPPELRPGADFRVRIPAGAQFKRHWAPLLVAGGGGGGGLTSAGGHGELGEDGAPGGCASGCAGGTAGGAGGSRLSSFTFPAGGGAGFSGDAVSTMSTRGARRCVATAPLPALSPAGPATVALRARQEDGPPPARFPKASCGFMCFPKASCGFMCFPKASRGVMCSRFPRAASCRGALGPRAGCTG
jgi:hypothetical protein